MARTKPMLLVTDERGRVVAAAHVGRPAGEGPRAEIVALPGQRIHRVKVPADIAGLSQGHDLHRALSRVRVDAKTGQLRVDHMTGRPAGSRPGRSRKARRRTERRARRRRGRGKA